MIFSNISALSKGKGLSVFIEAIPILKDLEHQFYIVGKALPAEEYLEKQLREKVKSLDLQKKVSFLGFIPNISKHFEKVDVVVHTATVPDSLPTILIEALAKGRVIIASDIGGVKEIVGNNDGNLVISPNDPDILAQAMKEVSCYRISKLEMIKEKNIERAKEYFSMFKQVTQTETIYHQVLGKH
jgi:glycosyltransferase involved in cell wall biosynthesis